MTIHKVFPNAFWYQFTQHYDGLFIHWHYFGKKYKSKNKWEKHLNPTYWIASQANIIIQYRYCAGKLSVNEVRERATAPVLIYFSFGPLPDWNYKAGIVLHPSYQKKTMKLDFYKE